MTVKTISKSRTLGARAYHWQLFDGGIVLLTLHFPSQCSFPSTLLPHFSLPLLLQTLRVVAFSDGIGGTDRRRRWPRPLPPIRRIRSDARAGKRALPTHLDHPHLQRSRMVTDLQFILSSLLFSFLDFNAFFVVFLLAGSRPWCWFGSMERNPDLRLGRVSHGGW